MSQIPAGALPPDDGNSLFTIDLSGDGGIETPGQTFGRIIGGIVLMIVGAAIGLGSIALLIASIVVPSVQDWFDIITEFWWIIGGLGLGLLVFGFELVRRGRKRNRSAREGTFNTLAASGLVDTETVDSRTTVTDAGGFGAFGTDNNPNRKPPPAKPIT